MQFITLVFVPEIFKNKNQSKGWVFFFNFETIISQIFHGVIIASKNTQLGWINLRCSHLIHCALIPSANS